MTKYTIKLSLSKDEALVLFEMLSRFSDTDKLNIEHPAEKQALWNLNCALEKILLEPFDKDYIEALKAAQKNLTNGH